MCHFIFWTRKAGSQTLLSLVVVVVVVVLLLLLLLLLFLRISSLKIPKAFSIRSAAQRKFAWGR